MNENIKASVIIPAYNCEDYIDELFECLLNQTLEDIEIIVVDNASTDLTYQMVSAYADKYERVRLLSEPSQGAGIARNTGIENANGRYLVFLDADDLYDKNMLEKLYAAMDSTNADMGLCSALKIDYATGKESRLSSFSKNETITDDRVYTCKDFENPFTAFDVSPQNKIFLRSFVEENNLKFSPTKSSNDLLFTEKARLLAERIAFVTEDLVTIRRNYNAQSLSSTRKKSSEDIVTVLRDLYSFLKTKGLEEELKYEFLRFCCRHIRYGAQQGKNDAFINAVTAWLDEEPWSTISKEEFYSLLGFCSMHSELIKARLVQSIENTEEDEKKIIFQNELEARTNQEYTLLRLIDFFFDGDKALIERCELEQIKLEYTGAYNQAKDRADKISALKEKNKRLSADKKELKAGNRELKEKNKALKEKNSELKAECKELKVSNKELKAAHKELRAAHKELKATNKELKAAHKELKAGNRELKAAYKDAKSRNKELKARNKELKGKNKSLAKQNKKIKGSASYKIGRIITFIPRKIKRLFKK